MIWWWPWILQELSPLKLTPSCLAFTVGMNVNTVSAEPRRARLWSKLKEHSPWKDLLGHWRWGPWLSCLKTFSLVIRKWLLPCCNSGIERWFLASKMSRDPSLLPPNISFYQVMSPSVEHVWKSHHCPAGLSHHVSIPGCGVAQRNGVPSLSSRGAVAELQGHGWLWPHWQLQTSLAYLRYQVT